MSTNCHPQVLHWIIDNTDDDLKTLENQMKKAGATWGRSAKILKMKTDSNILINYIMVKCHCFYGVQIKAWPNTRGRKNRRDKA